MKTQNIVVEGLPEGCEAVAVQFDPNYFNKYTGEDGYIYFEAKVKVKKIQPRMMVFEEILDHSTIKMTDHFINGVWCREANENDNEEPYLKLSVAECNGLFEGNQPAINKVKEFIEGK